MNLLDKFSTVTVDNTTRIDKTLYSELKSLQDICDKRAIEYSMQIAHLGDYRSNSKTHPFDEFVKTIKDSSSSMYYCFASDCFDKINKHYDLNIRFYDFTNIYNKSVYSVDEIVDYFFTRTNGVDLLESGKQRIKDMMFNRFNERWRKPIPSVTKSGVVTLPSVCYIDTYWSNRNDSHKIDRSDDIYMEMVNKSFNLFYNDSIDMCDVFDNFKVKGENYYYYKNKTEINTMGVESVTFYANGNLKIKFIDKTDALRYFEFYNLHNCKENK